MGFAAIGLHHPKYDVNVGSVIRAAGVYNAAFVAATGKRVVRVKTDPKNEWRHRPFFNVDNLHDMIPFSCVPVAVDIIEGAQPLPEYEHPERAFYIFGPEDGTLGHSITSWCRDTIYVPTNGCMNLAACVNVILYDRFTKGLNNHV